MTQQQMAPAQAPQQQVHPLQKTLIDLDADRQRLVQALANPTPQKLGMEINDTVLSYVHETLQHVGQVFAMVEQLNRFLHQTMPDINSRLQDLEDDAAADDVGLDEETHALLFEIAAKCQGFVESGLTELAKVKTKSADEQAAFDELSALKQKCEQAIQFLSDDEEGEEEEPPPTAAAPSGSNGVPN